MLPEIYFAVSTYALLATVGLVLAVLFVYFRADKVGLRFIDLIEYIIVCTVLALLCAKMLFAIAMIPSMAELDAAKFFHNFVYGGIVFYGGLFGVIIGIALMSKIKKRSAAEILDFAAPAFPLFHTFARIGCLLAGCCYGVPWSWGVYIQGEDVVRFPVQLFESLCDALIFAVLMCHNRKSKTCDGNLKIYLCSYAVCRFILEFFRGDYIRGIWFGVLSTAQIISLLVLAVYFALTLKKHVKNREVNV